MSEQAQSSKTLPAHLEGSSVTSIAFEAMNLQPPAGQVLHLSLMIVWRLQSIIPLGHHRWFGAFDGRYRKSEGSFRSA
jgi:hypothetical protein